MLGNPTNTGGLPLNKITRHRLAANFAFARPLKQAERRVAPQTTVQTPADFYEGGEA